MVGAVQEPRYAYVHVDVHPDDSELVSLELWELGAEGLEERDGTTLTTSSEGVTLVAYFSEEAQARRVADTLGRRFPARVEHVVGDDWRDGWRAYFKPSRVGARLVIRPSWEPVRPYPGEVMLTIDPGRAFGSGIHETTRLVLREIDRRVRPGDAVLDVGCGSGILSIAALLLGARRAVGIDVDEDALPVAVANARLNRVVSRFRARAVPVEQTAGRFDLVVANIEARVLVPLASAIGAKVAPAGTLVLSGILRGQEDEVLEAYRARCPGLRFVGPVPFENEWVALVLRRPSARGSSSGASSSGGRSASRTAGR